MCEDCAELAARVEELEAQVDKLTHMLGSTTIPDQQEGLEALELGEWPIGRILSGKTSALEVETIAREEALKLQDGGVANNPVSQHRDKLLPVHRMALDTQQDAAESLSKQQERAARLWLAIWERAGGEVTPVDVGKSYYTMDSSQAFQVITEAEDGVKPSSQAAIVGRAFEELQAGTKVEDCDCPTIRACEHGMVVFDDTGNPNRVEVEKRKLHAYQQTVKTAVESDDESEQLSEDLPRAEADAAEAADEQLDQLDAAEPVQANTVVSSKNGSVLDSR